MTTLGWMFLIEIHHHCPQCSMMFFCVLTSWLFDWLTDCHADGSDDHQKRQNRQRIYIPIRTYGRKKFNLLQFNLTITTTGFFDRQRRRQQFNVLVHDLA